MYINVNHPQQQNVTSSPANKSNLSAASEDDVRSGGEGDNSPSQYLKLSKDKFVHIIIITIQFNTIQYTALHFTSLLSLSFPYPLPPCNLFNNNCILCCAKGAALITSLPPSTSTPPTRDPPDPPDPIH